MSDKLTAAAKRILMKESNDSKPDRDAKATNQNRATLHPNGGTALKAEPDPKHNEATVLDAEPPKELSDGPDKGQNLGAKAAATVGKDTSKSSQHSPGEKFGLKEADIEISEELSEFIDKLVAEGKTDEEIQKAIEENFDIVDADEVDVKAVSEELVIRNRAKLKEHVDALLEGEKLSEDFREKATTIFDTAIAERLTEEVAVLEEAYQKSLEEKVAEIHETLQKRVDECLNYVTEAWIKDNKVALDSGLRNELTESFITGMRTLFLEHYIDVPEDKVDVVETLGSENAELKAKLNEEIEKNIELSKSITEAKKIEITSKVCEGLNTVQSEKLKALAENVLFADAETFEGKLNTLRESYFPSKAVKTDSVLDNEPDAAKPGVIAEGAPSHINRYVATIGNKMRAR